MIEVDLAHTMIQEMIIQSVFWGWSYDLMIVWNCSAEDYYGIWKWLFKVSPVVGLMILWLFGIVAQSVTILVIQEMII